MACKHPAGETCHCNMNEPCLDKYTIWSDGPTVEYKAGGEWTKSIHLLDSGEGAEISISVEGCCETKPTTCPSGYIKSGTSYSEKISTTACESYKLPYYDPDTTKIDLYRAVKLLLGETPLRALPSTRYVVHITQCCGYPQREETHFINTINTVIRHELGMIGSDTQIFVYPETVISSKLTLSRVKVEDKLSEKERADAYKSLEQNNGQVKKDQVKISPKKIKKKFSLSGSLTIKQGSLTKEYSTSPSTKRTKKNSGKQTINFTEEAQGFIEQLQMIDAIIDIVSEVKSGIYTNEKGKDKIKLVSFSMKSPTIVVDGTQTTKMINEVMTLESSGSVDIKPLLGFTLKLDLLLAAAAFYKVESAVAAIREKAQALEKNVKEGKSGAYAGAEFDVIVDCDSAATVKFSQSPGSEIVYTPSITGNITIKAAMNIRGGAKVWIFEGAFELKGEIVAVGECALKSTGTKEKPKVELIFFHNGIKATVTMKASAKINTGKASKSSSDSTHRNNINLENKPSENKPSEDKPMEWIWAEALPEAQSKCRITVIG